MSYFMVHCLVVLVLFVGTTLFYLAIHWLCSKDFFLVLPLALALLVPAPARGEPNLLPKCETALHDCNDVVKAQGERIENLKIAVTTWKKEAEKGTSVDAPVILTSTMSGLLGGAIAGGLSGSKNGIIEGGALGGVVGLVFGFFIERVR